MSEPRFTLGIDLGTTHVAVAFTRLDESDLAEVAIHEFALPQTIAPFEVDERPHLPSFLYLPAPGELAEGATALPWTDAPASLVGEFARSHGSSVPTRLVASAKSWLSHPGVDRMAAILPIDAEPEVPRVSPFEASVAYLGHVRDAWDDAFPGSPFAEQEITITVPASFDPIARQLTADAARAVGASRLSLVEEPQAALHALLAAHARDLSTTFRAGDVVLVVDVGGGTTDFSLIAIEVEDGVLAPRRVAVSDHILLGGDNMDLAVAAFAGRAFEEKGTALDAHDRRALVFAARSAKERLLSGEAVVTLTLAGRGSRLVGGSKSVELSRDALAPILVDGFFPHVAIDARPASRPRASLTTIGLPYAQDPSITAHLAAFLARHRAALDPASSARFLHPTAVLFNGGVFRASAFAARIADSVDRWLGDDAAQPARRLEGTDLDRQVARGAAYHAFVRRRGGIRIRGGSAQALYVGVETAAPAIPGLPPPVTAYCVAPFGLDEGQSAAPMPIELGLVVGEATRLAFYGSNARREDEVGTRVDRIDELVPLGELDVSLPPGDLAVGEILPVRIAASIGAQSTLLLHAHPRGGGEPIVLAFGLPRSPP